MLSWNKIHPSLEVSFLMWLWIKTHWLLPAKGWNKTQCPCSMQRLQIDHYSTEHLVGLRIESVFPTCSQNAAMVHCCPFVPMPALSSGFSPSLQGGSRGSWAGSCSWGAAQGSRAVPPEEGRVASNACSSLAVGIFQGFCVFLTHHCGVEYFKVKIDLLMQCLAGCVGWRGGNSSLVVLPKFYFGSCACWW